MNNLNIILTAHHEKSRDEGWWGRRWYCSLRHTNCPMPKYTEVHPIRASHSPFDLSWWTVSTTIIRSGFEERSHYDGEPLGEVLPNLASENATGCGWLVGGTHTLGSTVTPTFSGGGGDQAFPLKATAYTTQDNHIFSLLSLSWLLLLLVSTGWFRVPYQTPDSTQQKERRRLLLALFHSAAAICDSTSRRRRGKRSSVVYSCESDEEQTFY